MKRASPPSLTATSTDGFVSPTAIELPDNQQDRDMIARELALEVPDVGSAPAGHAQKGLQEVLRRAAPASYRLPADPADADDRETAIAEACADDPRPPRKYGRADRLFLPEYCGGLAVLTDARLCPPGRSRKHQHPFLAARSQEFAAESGRSGSISARSRSRMARRARSSTAAT